MTVLFLVFPLALLLSAFAVLAFLWAVHKGQFDDLATPALRVLTDDCSRTEREPSQPQSKQG